MLFYMMCGEEMLSCSEEQRMLEKYTKTRLRTILHSVMRLIGRMAVCLVSNFPDAPWPHMILRIIRARTRVLEDPSRVPRLA